MSLFPNAAFDRAVHQVADLPPDTGAEVAFAGRSNAGKSSAINAIVDQRHLALVSKTPGRTRTINFFSLGARRYLVDLPGYGYAAVPEKQQRRWDELISAYLTRRRALRGLILICDARQPMTPLDQQLITWFAPLSRPVHVLLTKADKLSRTQGARALRNTDSDLKHRFTGVTVQLFSGTRRTGVAAAQRLIHAWLK